MNYVGGIFSHFDGSNEEFFYCDRVGQDGARMTNVIDFADVRQVAISNVQRTYIKLSDDLRRRLGVADVIVANVVAHYANLT